MSKTESRHGAERRVGRKSRCVSPATTVSAAPKPMPVCGRASAEPVVSCVRSPSQAVGASTGFCALRRLSPLRCSDSRPSWRWNGIYSERNQKGLGGSRLAPALPCSTRSLRARRAAAGVGVHDLACTAVRGHALKLKGRPHRCKDEHCAKHAQNRIYHNYLPRPKAEAIRENTPANIKQQRTKRLLAPTGSDRPDPPLRGVEAGAARFEQDSPSHVAGDDDPLGGTPSPTRRTPVGRRAGGGYRSYSCGWGLLVCLAQ
jgi:hypothetical protein